MCFLDNINEVTYKINQYARFWISTPQPRTRHNNPDQLNPQVNT
jgi:hypothetical protein